MIDFSNNRGSWWVLALALAITALSGALLSHSRAETSVAGLLDPSDPSVVALGQVLDRFPIVDEMLLFVTASEQDADPHASLLRFASRFETRAAEDPDGRQTITAVRYRASPQMKKFIESTIVPHGLDYLDDAAFAQFLAGLSPSGMAEQFAQNRAMLAVPGPAAGEIAKAFIHDPLRLRNFLVARLGDLKSVAPSAGEDAFFSPDGRSLLLRISGTKPPGDLDFCRQITRTTSRLAREANDGNFSIDIAGAYAIATHSADAIRWDSIVGVNVTVVAIAALFVGLYRGPVRQFGFAFLPMAMGLAWGFGAYAFGHATFTPLAAVVGGALGGVGINYGVFFLAHYDRALIVVGSPDVAARQTLKRLRVPLLAAWATSVIGFAAIAFSPIRVLRDFAILGALALLGAYVAAITVLPAALTALDRRPYHINVVPARLAAIAPLGRFIARWPRALLTLAGCVWLTLLIGFVQSGATLLPDSNLLSLHPQPNPPIEAQRKIANRMGIAPGTVQLYLKGDSPDQLMRRAHEVDRRLRAPNLATAGFFGSFGIASLLPDPIGAACHRAAIDSALPERASQNLLAAAQAAGFQSRPFEPSSNFLRSFVAPTGNIPGPASLNGYPEIAQLVLARDAIAGGDARDALVTVFFNNPLDRRTSRDAAIGALHNALAGVDGVVITGMSAINDHIEATIYRDLPRLVAIAISCIAICLWLNFRSLGLALLALLPTLVSMTVVLSFMRFTHLPLDLVNMVMVPLLLGIDVDYSILTISAWRTARSREDLIAAFPTTASAVITCVATTLVGFGSLILTSVPAVRSLGLLITVGVLSCLTASLFVLWPILFLMKPGAERSR